MTDRTKILESEVEALRAQLALKEKEIQSLKEQKYTIEAWRHKREKYVWEKAPEDSL